MSDRYGAVATYRNGVSVVWFGSDKKRLMADADRDHPQARNVTIRTDRTSDGAYQGPGGGRVVAQREHGRWTLDMGDSTTDPRAYEPARRRGGRFA